MRQLDAMAALPPLEWNARRVSVPAWRVGLIWLLGASSSIVLIEPAPYDLLAIGALAAFLLTGMQLSRSLIVPLFMLAVFLLGNWLAAVTSPDPVATLRSLGIRTYLCGTLLLFACAVLPAPQRMLKAIWGGYALAALVAAVWGVLQYLGYVPRPDGWFRAQGPFKDPNVFGPFLVPVALWCIEVVFERRGRARAIGFALLVTVLFGILISFSRGAWLNLFGATLTYFALRFLSVRSSRSRLRMLGASLVVLVLCTGLITVAARSERFADQFVERARLIQQYDVAESGRFAAQARALLSAATNPLGVGPGRSAHEFGLEPHNLYLHVVSEGGWIAGLAFWSFLALTLAKSLPLLRRPWSFARETQIAFAAVAGILLQSFFIDSTHWRHLYLLLGVLWALIVVRSREPAHNSP